MSCNIEYKEKHRLARRRRIRQMARQESAGEHCNSRRSYLKKQNLCMQVEKPGIGGIKMFYVPITRRALSDIWFRMFHKVYAYKVSNMPTSSIEQKIVQKKFEQARKAGS
jgi:hypothetical protein